MAVKLYNQKAELFALILMTRDMLSAGTVMSVVQDESYFAMQWAREAFRLVKGMYARMDAADGVVTFSSLMLDNSLSDETRERLEDGYDRFKDAPIEVEKVLKQLQQFRTLRGLNELSEIINSTFHHEDEIPDATEMIGVIQDHISGLRFKSSNLQDHHFTIGKGSNIGPVVERVINPEKRLFIPTGIDEFDDKNGGVTLGAVMMIVGTTGGGKSLLAQNVAESMAMYAEKGVCYVPLEMTEEEMVQRSMAAKGKVAVHKIVAGKWSDDEQERCLAGLDRYNKALKKLDRRFGMFVPPEDMTFDEIITYLHPYDYDVIFIDYISLLKGAEGDDQWRELTNITRRAKIYARTHKKIVVLLAQLSDEGKIRYARGMLENANLAWTFVATEATKQAGEMHITQPKARGFDPSPITLDVDYAFMLVNGSRVSSDSVSVDSDEPTEKKGKASGKGKTAQPTSKGKQKDDSYFDDMET